MPLMPRKGGKILKILKRIKSFIRDDTSMKGEKTDTASPSRLTGAKPEKTNIQR